MHAGFAAGCEAGLRPAVSILNWLGLCPWSGLGPQRSGKARTRGTAQSGNQLTAGQSPASHRAAKPELRESNFRGGSGSLIRYLTSGGKAAAISFKVTIVQACPN